MLRRRNSVQSQHARLGPPRSADRAAAAIVKPTLADIRSYNKEVTALVTGVAGAIKAGSFDIGNINIVASLVVGVLVSVNSSLGVFAKLNGGLRMSS